jgi:hypothetical protein
MAIQWLFDDPLARVPGESKLASQALQDYARQTPGKRSLRELRAGYIQRASSSDAAQTPPTTKQNTLDAWSLRNEWQARVNRFDDLEVARVQALRDAAEAAEIEKWAKRRQEHREREWTLATGLAERATSMLRTPLFRTETEDGRNVIMPARWDWGDVPRVADTASKLARLAAEMPTAREHLAFEGVSDEQLAATLAVRLGSLIAADDGGAEAEPEPGADQESGPGDSAGTETLPE